MSDKSANRRILREYLQVRKTNRVIAEIAEDAARQALFAIGGMAGNWSTLYSECTYYAPQRLNGELVDLSTIEKVRQYYYSLPATQAVA